MSEVNSTNEEDQDAGPLSPKSISSTRTLMDLDSTVFEGDHLEQILILFSSLEFSSEETRLQFDNLLIESYAKLFIIYFNTLSAAEKNRLNEELLKNVSRICISEATLHIEAEGVEEGNDPTVNGAMMTSTHISESSERIVFAFACMSFENIIQHQRPKGTIL